MNLRNFFGELKRRNVYKVFVAYLVIAWLVIQAASILLPTFDAPTWAMKLVVVILGLVFPVALILAWAFEITPEGIKLESEVAPNESIRKRTGRKIIGITIAIAVVATGLFVFKLLRPSLTKISNVPPSTAEVIPPKSIAVLPFENLTQEAENAFFADGIQDDILTSLAKIQDLKVISRTSVMRYREIKSRNLREIGSTLGAANILEGSVRRSGDRLRLTVQLIDARTDRHIWAESYDRTVSDALTLQGELAKVIAAALRATLSPDEKERVERKPTDNADAYVLYLRARQYEFSPDTLLQDYKVAEQLYEKAIALDSAFAVAQARLAITRAAIFHYHEPLEAWKTKVLAGAEAALRLEPNLGEAHVALGLYYYWTERDYDRALPEFALAQRLSPSDASVASLIASIRRRQGQWKEALELYERAETLDPQNPNVVRNLFYTLTALRDWPAAARLAERLRVLFPDSVASKIQTAYVDFNWNESTAALKTTLDALPAGVDPDGVVTTGRWDVCMIERDYAGAEQALERSSLDEFSYLNAQTTPKRFLQGCIALARGDAARAQKDFGAALAQFEASVAESPQVAERHANLGLLYAFLGRKEEAVREGRRAVELMPETKDAVDGPLMNCFLALIYARNEEPDLAIPLLERLLKTPGAVDSTFYSVTEADLAKRWVWDPIRNDPRFGKLRTQREEAPAP